MPGLARGNSKLQVETNTGFEVGYRGDLSDKFYISVDAYFNSLGNFVTDLLPGNNPAFKFWTSPTAVPAAVRGTLESTVRNLLLASPARCWRPPALTTTVAPRPARLRALSSLVNSSGLRL